MPSCKDMQTKIFFCAEESQASISRKAVLWLQLIALQHFQLWHWSPIPQFSSLETTQLVNITQVNLHCNSPNCQTILGYSVKPARERPSRNLKFIHACAIILNRLHIMSYSSVMSLPICNTCDWIHLQRVLPVCVQCYSVPVGFVH